MGGRNATQREVVDRLSVLLRPARAAGPAAPQPPDHEGRGGGRARGAPSWRDARASAIQQRYRLYRVCGFGFLSACFYAIRPNVA